MGDLGSIPGLGRSPIGRNGNPHQYSCLENSTDRILVGYSPWGRKESDTTEWPTLSQILHCVYGTLFRIFTNTGSLNRPFIWLPSIFLNPRTIFCRRILVGWEFLLNMSTRRRDNCDGGGGRGDPVWYLYWKYLARQHIFEVQEIDFLKSPMPCPWEASVYSQEFKF